MRILVTGGSGFIGSHIVKAYIGAGHDVAVIDDLSTGKRGHLHPQARFYQVDVADGAAQDVVRDEHPTILNHHAAQMDVRRSVADPLFDARVNILGLLNLLEAARVAGVEKVIFASSGGTVYGEQETFPASEAHKTEPLSPYGVSKLAGERYLFYYCKSWGIPYVALRYANVYGPRQDPHGEAGVVAIFTERFLKKEQPVIHGDGTQTRDYLYVDDAVEANLLALQTEYAGPLNIGTGKETDVITLFHHLRRLTGSQAPEVHGPAKLGEQRRSVLDCRAATRVLGWQPRVDLEEGLRRTVEYFRQAMNHR